MTDASEIKSDYVLGFVFTSDYRKVLLVKKMRPFWQKGKLNGIGGKVEENDTSALSAMKRKFEEETGFATTNENWHFFCRLYSHGICDCFVMTMDIHDLYQYRQIEDEILKVYHVENPQMKYFYKHYERIDNLDWLIPLAINHHSSGGELKSVDVFYDHKEKHEIEESNNG